ARAPGGHGGAARGGARPPGPARLDDRDGPALEPRVSPPPPMNGVHDMGGLHGFGPVRVGADEPVFHDDWERRTFALTLAAGARRWNIDRGRFAREQMPPAEYLPPT